MNQQKKLLIKHIEQLQNCRLCSKMAKPVVTGGAIWSKIILVGQAPGTKEPLFGRPFAWTAGKTLFKWFDTYCGLSEENFRNLIYMAAVCRCFPGKEKSGGDRVPDEKEIANCSQWLKKEIEILQPELLLPVGKLAISQFLNFKKLDEVVGKKIKMAKYDTEFDVVPLPHPSGASPWHRISPGKELLEKAFKIIKNHPAFVNLNKQ
jgi:uracil-DNA glycosylase